LDVVSYSQDSIQGTCLLVLGSSHRFQDLVSHILELRSIWLNLQLQEDALEQADAEMWGCGAEVLHACASTSDSRLGSSSSVHDSGDCIGKCCTVNSGQSNRTCSMMAKQSPLKPPKPPHPPCHLPFRTLEHTLLPLCLEVEVHLWHTSYSSHIRHRLEALRFQSLHMPERKPREQEVQTWPRKLETNQVSAFRKERISTYLL